MRLPPILYQKIIRPKFAIRKYIQNIIQSQLTFENKKILDFGCGTGSICFIFNPSDYVGVDIDIERINYARELFPDYFFLPIKDQKIPFPSESFDFIIIIATLHHIADKLCLDYIKEFSRILKQEGKIVVIEPCLFLKSYLNNQFMEFFDEGRYIRTQKDYLKLFENKFKVTIHKKFKKILFYNEIFLTMKEKDTFLLSSSV